jgi:hypothetical protein
MAEEYYTIRNFELSSALHAHFVDLYGAFKLGIRDLSLLWVNKCCILYEKGDDLVGQ